MGFQLSTIRKPFANTGLGASLYRSDPRRRVPSHFKPLVAVVALAAVGLLVGCATLDSINLPWQSSTAAMDAKEVADPVDRPLVARAQRGLTALGYRPGPADGIAGRNTATAVRAYQRKAGLRVDGRVSPGLVEHIEKALSELPRDGEAARSHNAYPPAYEIGTTFIYSDGQVDTVASLKGDMVRWVRNDGTRFTAHRNFLLPWYYWQSASESGTVTLEGDAKRLWPRRAGREYRFSTKTMVQTAAGSDGLTDWTEAWRCRFDGREPLTVIAGHFKTVKFTCLRAATESRPALERIWFYAPEIGHYVRVVESSSAGRTGQPTDLVAIRPSGETWPPIARAALERAVEQALNSAEKGEARPWSSSGVRTRVTIKPTSGFRDLNGKRCRSFVQTWSSINGRHRYPGAACRDSSGRWRIPGLEESTNETLAISGGTS